MRLVAGSNTGKQAIARNARIFVLQHFWRVLHHRHSAALRRRSAMLKRSFARLLNTGEQSIHQDLLAIRRRLGPNWVERGANSTIGPFWATIAGRGPTRPFPCHVGRRHHRQLPGCLTRSRTPRMRRSPPAARFRTPANGGRFPRVPEFRQACRVAHKCPKRPPPISIAAI